MGSCCPGPHGSAPDNEIYHPFIAYTQDTLQWVASLVTKLVFLEAKEMRDIRHHITMATIKHRQRKKKPIPVVITTSCPSLRLRDFWVEPVKGRKDHNIYVGLVVLAWVTLYGLQTPNIH